MELAAATLSRPAACARVRILVGDCRQRLRELADRSVHCVVTSPPYWSLRDYGVAGQLGLEPTPEAYVAGVVDVFRDVRRALRDDGTFWLVLGDSFAGSWGNYGARKGGQGRPFRGSVRRLAFETPARHGGWLSRFSVDALSALPNKSGK